MSAADADAALSAAIAREGAAQINDAVSLYLQSVVIDPTRPAAYDRLGLVMARAGHPQTGGRLARRAVTLDPQTPAYRHNLGALLYVQGRPEEAAAVFIAVCLADPAFAPAAADLERLASRGETGRAGATPDGLRTLAAVRPDLATIYAVLAEQSEETDIEAALSAYNRSLILNPDQGGLRAALWGLRRRRGEFSDYYSGEGQDAFIHRAFFPERRGGFFVDIGAYDGVTGSNTLFFERALDWTGLCIEPSPGLFAELTANRPGPCLNVAVADFDGEADFLDVPEGPRMVGGLVAHCDSRIRAELTRLNAPQEIRRVTVRRLSSVLADAGVRRIDYCSIDAEGADEAVLESLDLTEIRVEVFSVENRSGDPELRRSMLKRGYDFIIRLGCDDIFRRRDREAVEFM